MPNNEIPTIIPNGIPVTLQFEIANPAAGATTDLTLAQGGSGFVVPTGFAFYPLVLGGVSNADLTAGTATFQVIFDGTEQANGPSAQLADTVQRATGVARFGAVKAAAGTIVGVSVTTNAGYLPVTADLDAVLIGYLAPA